MVVGARGYRTGLWPSTPREPPRSDQRARTCQHPERSARNRFRKYFLRRLSVRRWSSTGVCWPVLHGHERPLPERKAKAFLFEPRPLVGSGKIKGNYHKERRALSHAPNGSSTHPLCEERTSDRRVGRYGTPTENPGEDWLSGTKKRGESRNSTKK